MSPFHAITGIFPNPVRFAPFPCGIQAYILAHTQPDSQRGVYGVTPIPFSMATRNTKDDDGETGIAVETREKTKRPPLYKVMLLNDDYTPMEFVVLVLKRFFNMDMDQATRVMLHVHQKGVGICGTFSYEVAETKVTQVMDFARKNEHPLQCTLEKA